MGAPKSRLVLIAVVLAVIGIDVVADEPEVKAKKKAATKGEAVVLDPTGRPEGSIVDQSARYYVWHDSQGWHLRTTAKVGRNFHGTVSVKEAQIKTFKSVGLKNDKQGGADDTWRVNDARSELTFQFKTGKLSDGLDFVVDGDDGQIEFELYIDKQKSPQAIFIGRGQQHPPSNPFSLPATPKKTK
jgi:hypothetical protein